MRRVGFIVLGVLLLAIAAIALFFHTAPVPEHGGHSADYWLDAVFSRPPATNTTKEAISAFRAMDETNALHYLLRALERPETGTAKLHMSLYDHSPGVLRKLISRPNYLNRSSAAELVLMNLHETSTVVPELISIVKRSSGLSRQLALTVLMNRVQTEHPEYATTFVPLLTETNAAVRFLAVQLLANIENKSGNVVSSVSKTLNDPDDTVRISAAYAIWKLTGATNTAVPVLKEELIKSNTGVKSYSPYYNGPMVRKLIFHHLFEIDPKSPVVAEYFRERTKSDDPKVRREACVQMKELTRQGRFLVLYIAPLLNDPDAEVKSAAEEALRDVNISHYNFDPR